MTITKSRKKLEDNLPFILRNWKKFTAQEMGDKIGVSESYYRRYLYSLGLRKMNKNPWKIKELLFLKANYNRLENQELAIELDRTLDSVTAKLCQLKLKRHPSFLFKIRSKNAKEKGFANGYGDAVKGRKQKQVGEKWIINGLWRIKLGKGKIVKLHTYLWKEKHGEIPKLHRIRFKDGDSLNCTIENLIAVRLTDEELKANRLKKMSTMDRIMSGYVSE